MSASFSTFATVTLDSGLPKPLTYGIPEELIAEVSEGTRVLVPLRGRPKKATVVSLSKRCTLPRVQAILGREEGELPNDLLQLARWMSDYYFAPLPTVLRAMRPRTAPQKKQLFVTPTKSREELRAACVARRKRAPVQANLLENLLKVRKGILLTELLEAAGASRSAVQALEKAGFVKLAPMIIDRSPLADQDYFRSPPKRLTEEQSRALDRINGTEGFGVHLLHGVTGSGKTEVYLQAIAEVLQRGESALVLVPEIALTAQTLERFRARFEDQIAVFHSRLSEGERSDAWRRLRSGELRLVLGARSALFAPLQNLGLIIVDEEHEGSYKQSEGAPLYHARDVAVMRGKVSSCPVVLGSATPSLESYRNALSGKYQLSTLSKRPGAEMPTVRIVEPKAGLLSDELLAAIKQRFVAGEQSLLFLNRRGYHAMLWCATCREALSCPHCALSLTFHRGQQSLACHLCGYTTAPPQTCPKCRTPDPLRWRGAGTEQVEARLRAIFPEIRTLRLDADTTRHKGSHEQLLGQFRTGKADLLIGTQMVAKGLHFPQVTLVGVLNTDAALQIPDFRSGERVFQLLTQVAGRAGRSELKGEVIIQSRSPQNRIVQLAAAQDYLSFYREEIEARELLSYPPFTRLIKLTFTGKDEKRTSSWAEKIRQKLGSPSPVTPCGYAKIKDRFRFQFLLAGKSSLLRQISLSTPGVEVQVDVDPLSTYF